jgi:hypothetical protein
VPRKQQQADKGQALPKRATAETIQASEAVSRPVVVVSEPVNAVELRRRSVIMQNYLAGIEAGSEAVRRSLEAIRDGEVITEPRDLQSVAVTVGIMQDKVDATQKGAAQRFGDDPTASWSVEERLILKRITRSMGLEPPPQTSQTPDPQG